MFQAIDYIITINKKKPTKERTLKYIARSSLELLEDVLQMLLDNLEEKDILENRANDPN